MNKGRIPYTPGLRATMFLLLALFSVNSFAQYNKVVFNSLSPGGIPTGEAGWDIVDAGNGNTCVLSTQWKVLNLKEFDFMGNIIAHETFYNGIQQEYLLAERVLRAPNGDYIVVGRNLVPHVSCHPFAARFRTTGGAITCLWFNEYLTNNTGVYNAPESQVSVVLAEDDVNESYIIATEADDSNTSVAGAGTMTIQAFKIDANGTLIWNYKYYDNGGTTRNLFVNALTYGEIQEGQGALKKYFIGGSVDKRISFDMTIDGNGNIVDQYREYDMPGDEFWHNALYDGSTNEFVLANTMTSNSLATSTSQIAVTKIDFPSMTLVSTDIYYENDPSSTSCSTMSRKIIEDATGGNYIIGGQTSKNFNGTSLLHAGPAILKINKLGAVQFLKRYNRLGSSHGMSVTDVVDPGSSIENYVMVAVAGNSRVFATDITGVTCGEESLTDAQDNLSLSPISYTFARASMSGTNAVNYGSGSTYQVRDCDPGNPEYKPASVSELKANINTTLHPNPANNELNIRLEGAISGETEVLLVNVYGQKLAVLYKGGAEELKTTKKLQLPQLPTGIYMVQVFNKGQRTYSGKLKIQQ